MQSQKVEGMATCAPRLEVGNKCIWCDVSVKRLHVLDLPHPHIFDSGEDELRSLSSRRLVGAAVVVVGAVGFVRHFSARADDSRGIVINSRVVGANSCGFGKIRAIARCVRCHRSNEADEIVCVSRFVVRDLEEERRHDLPDSREVGV